MTLRYSLTLDSISMADKRFRTPTMDSISLKSHMGMREELFRISFKSHSLTIELHRQLFTPLSRSDTPDQRVPLPLAMDISAASTTGNGQALNDDLPVQEILHRQDPDDSHRPHVYARLDSGVAGMFTPSRWCVGTRRSTRKASKSVTNPKVSLYKHILTELSPCVSPCASSSASAHPPRPAARSATPDNFSAERRFRGSCARRHTRRRSILGD